MYPLWFVKVIIPNINSRKCAIYPLGYGILELEFKTSYDKTALLALPATGRVFCFWQLNARLLEADGVAAQHRMLLVLGIVPQRMVEAVVGSATLFARQGTASDEQTGIEDVGSFMCTTITGAG